MALDTESLRSELKQLLDTADLTTATSRTIRSKLEVRMGLEEGSLKKHKKVLAGMMKSILKDSSQPKKKDVSKVSRTRKSRSSSGGSSSSSGSKSRKKSRSRNQKNTDYLSVPSDLGSNFSIYEDSQSGRKWAVMLNQTDIGYGIRGHNKFYALVLFTHAMSGRAVMDCHWGRVGHSGQSSRDEFASLTAAQSAFARKFKAKTKNEWSNAMQGSFEAIKGKYTMVDTMMDSDTTMMENNSEDDTIETDNDSKQPSQTTASKLDSRVIRVLDLMFDRRMMKRTLVDLKIDVDRCPLGKLSKKQIRKGYSILNKIERQMNSKKTNTSVDPALIIQLSNEFYTNIPHDFGFSLPPPISSASAIQSKVELLRMLSDLELTQRIVKKHDSLDVYYRALRCDLKALDPSSDDDGRWRMIESALKGTHGNTHDSYSLKLESILECERKGSSLRHSAFSECLPNKRLLWHGSRLGNFVGILSEGLRIAPSEAPITGSMFGKGLYFSDCASKSANYCHASEHHPYGLLLLCRVALGCCLEKRKADNLSQLPPPYHSVFGRGKCDTDTNDDVFTMDDGYTLHCRLLPIDSDFQSDLMYNEFIVYDVCQIQIAYIVLVKFLFHHG